METAKKRVRVLTESAVAHFSVSSYRDEPRSNRALRAPHRPAGRWLSRIVRRATTSSTRRSMRADKSPSFEQIPIPASRQRSSNSPRSAVTSPTRADTRSRTTRSASAPGGDRERVRTRSGHGLDDARKSAPSAAGAPPPALDDASGCGRRGRGPMAARAIEQDEGARTADTAHRRDRETPHTAKADHSENTRKHAPQGCTHSTGSAG